MTNIDKIIECNPDPSTSPAQWWESVDPAVLQLIDEVRERNRAGTLNWTLTHMVDVITSEFGVAVTPDKVRHYCGHRTGLRKWRL